MKHIHVCNLIRTWFSAVFVCGRQMDLLSDESG